MTGLELYHSKIKNWILKVVSNLPIPTKTSDLQNDSDFCKVVVSDEPPAEGTPDDVLTAILDGEPTPVVTSQDVLHIARVSELPEDPDPNTLYIVVEEA